MHIHNNRQRVKTLMVAAAVFINACSFTVFADARTEDIEERVKTVAVSTNREPEVIEEVIEVEPEIVEVVEQVVVEEEKTEYFDVPLSEDLQDHIFELCDGYGIDPAIVICMIERESTFRASAVGDHGESFGLMQIKKKYQINRMKKLGRDDLLDPYDNVTVGIDLLHELLETGDSIEWALMAYNGGASYANKKTSRGVVSNYASSVLTQSKRLERRV